MRNVMSISSLEAVQAMNHPVRKQVLEALRTPNTAANVAREMKLTRQNVNYHLKALVRVGLATHAGERRKGNFLEQLYQSVARRFVISPGVGWDPETLAETLRQQTSLANLARVGESLLHDASVLLERAADGAVEAPSSAIETKLKFAGAQARQQFMREYMSAVTPLLKKWGAAEGEAYKLTLMIYPLVEEDEDND